jgi:hypothetical protein
MSIPELQILVFLLTGGSMLSAAWMVTHARDVVLVLSAFLPLDPGKGRRLATRGAVCTAITVFGFSVTAEAYVILRAGAVL